MNNLGIFWVRKNFEWGKIIGVLFFPNNHSSKLNEKRYSIFYSTPNSEIETKTYRGYSSVCVHKPENARDKKASI